MKGVLIRVGGPGGGGGRGGNFSSVRVSRRMQLIAVDEVWKRKYFVCPQYYSGVATVSAFNAPELNSVGLSMASSYRTHASRLQFKSEEVNKRRNN